MKYIEEETLKKYTIIFFLIHFLVSTIQRALSKQKL